MPNQKNTGRLHNSSLRLTYTQLIRQNGLKYPRSRARFSQRYVNRAVMQPHCLAMYKFRLHRSIRQRIITHLSQDWHQFRHTNQNALSPHWDIRYIKPKQLFFANHIIPNWGTWLVVSDQQKCPTHLSLGLLCSRYCTFSNKALRPKRDPTIHFEKLHWFCFHQVLLHITSILQFSKGWLVVTTAVPILMRWPC